jgi:2-keto-3-deoxy-L-fuconate dehydrogenase
VTAAGQGIRRASALAMQAEGATVYATDVNTEALDALAAEGLKTFRLDVLGAVSIAAAVETTGELDVLFNCAGFVANGTILDCDEEQWAFSNKLNVTAMYRMNRAFLPGMLASGGGSIINMSSVGTVRGKL